MPWEGIWMTDASKKDNSRRLYKILALFSLIITVVTVSYGVIMSVFNGVEIVGQTFVDVEFPPIHVFPIFYMKPITWLNFAIIVLTYSTLELYKERIAALSEFKIKVIKTLSFLMAALSVYEVLFNFTLWSGLIAADAILGKLNPDVIINPFPNPKIPWNIVFTTKLYLAATILSTYIFYFVSKFERKT